MAITATSSGSTPRELIPTGNYIARCYKMIHIGTVEEVILGEKKIMNKVRIGWELPTEQRVFSEEKGLQPLVIDKEYTLSLHEKSALRATLKSWRGKDFTEDEAKAFDITKLLGVACMINIIHKPSKKDPSRSFEEIAGITAVPKGFDIPAQINPTFVLDYDNFDAEKFNTLPDFIKLKMQTSVEYLSMQNPSHREMTSQQQVEDVENEIPF
jgi:hypothetical protein